MPKYAFEDMTPGLTMETAERLVTREEIIRYAAQFDPQPFHLDEEAGRHSLLGGLAASGWHVCALYMRLICDAWVTDSTSLGAPGIDEVRWLKPLRPGDRIRVRSRIVEARRSKSRPEMGLIRIESEMRNQDGAVLMTLKNVAMMGLRHPEAAQ